MNGAAVQLSASIGSSGNPVQNWYDILNLPWSTSPYQLKISKYGYTATPQAFQTIRLDSSSVWFQADAPGVYRGQCAGFCNAQNLCADPAAEGQPCDATNRGFACQAGLTCQGTVANATCTACP